MKINYTNTGASTNISTNDGWTCKPSNDGSFGTCTKNDTGAGFDYICSGKKADGTWNKCEIATGASASQNKSGNSNIDDSVVYSGGSNRTFTYNSGGLLGESTKRFAEFNQESKMKSFEHRSKLGGAYALNYDEQGNRLSGSQIQDKYDAYLKNNANTQSNTLDKAFSDRFKKYDSFEQFKQDVRNSRMQKATGDNTISKQPVEINTTINRSRLGIAKNDAQMREAKEKELFNKLKQENINLHKQIEDSWANCTPEEEIYKNSSISREHMVRIGLIPPRVEKQPEDKIDVQIKELTDRFIKNNPKYQNTLNPKEYTSLKQELVRAAKDAQRSNNSKPNSIFDLFRKASLISTAKANPAGLAILAEEIIALGGTTLISAIIANKAIDDYSKYQELEESFSKPQVLSTPVQDQTGLQESLPIQKPLVNALPGFEGLSANDKMPLAEEFPITEIEYENLISLKEGEHTIKSRLKDQQLPTEGKIRFVPDKTYKPNIPLAKGPSNGYYDRFDNEWTKGPSRTPGEPFEWDVQLSEIGKAQLGHLSRDGNHINVSLKGRITHK